MNLSKIYFIILILLCGCVSIQYNPKDGSVNYTRFGNSKVKNLSITTSNGTNISLGSSEHKESEVLKEAVKTATSIASKGV